MCQAYPADSQRISFELLQLPAMLKGQSSASYHCNKPHMYYSAVSACTLLAGDRVSQLDLITASVSAEPSIHSA